MTKDQFLRELRMELSGKIPEKELISQLDFYEEYIRVRSVARTESEITEELGSPRLIAKSILASREGNAAEADEVVYEDGTTAKEKKKRNILTMPSWVFITLVVIVVILIGGLLLGLSVYLLPIILPLLLLYFVIKLALKYRDRK